MKRCTKCKQEKPITDFPKNNKFKSGLNTQCKTCANEYHRKYYKKNKRKFKDYYKNEKETKSTHKYNCIDCGKLTIKSYMISLQCDDCQSELLEKSRRSAANVQAFYKSAT